LLMSSTCEAHRSRISHGGAEKHRSSNGEDDRERNRPAFVCILYFILVASSHPRGAAGRYYYFILGSWQVFCLFISFK